jgi:hypothetical protein
MTVNNLTELTEPIKPELGPAELLVLAVDESKPNRTRRNAIHILFSLVPRTQDLQKLRNQIYRDYDAFSNEEEDACPLDGWSRLVHAENKRVYRERLAAILKGDEVGLEAIHALVEHWQWYPGHSLHGYTVSQLISRIRPATDSRLFQPHELTELGLPGKSSGYHPVARPPIDWQDVFRSRDEDIGKEVRMPGVSYMSDVKSEPQQPVSEPTAPGASVLVRPSVPLQPNDPSALREMDIWANRGAED